MEMRQVVPLEGGVADPLGQLEAVPLLHDRLQSQTGFLRLTRCYPSERAGVSPGLGVMAPLALDEVGAQLDPPALHVVRSSVIVQVKRHSLATEPDIEPLADCPEAEPSPEDRAAPGDEQLYAQINDVQLSRRG